MRISLSFRRYLIHYGELTGAAGLGYNCFDLKKSIGKPKYRKEVMFSNLGLVHGNPNTYKVTEYIYGYHSAIGVSNMIGYVAVTSDASMEVSRRRDILVCLRGTMGELEMLQIDVAAAWLVHSPEIFPEDLDVKVHKGWNEYYTSKEPKENSTSAREQVVNEINRLINLYKKEEISITFTGHSMGAAIATLSAMDIVYNDVNTVYDPMYGDHKKTIPVTVFGYASPMIGGKDGVFTQVYENLMLNKGLRILRISNLPLDTVPKLPTPWFYVHVGRELVVNHAESPFLKTISGLELVGFAHDMEVYMHMVAGPYKDENGEPKLRVERQLALLNKCHDALKDSSIAPVEWWVDKFKGLVQEDDGTWVMHV